MQLYQKSAASQPATGPFVPADFLAARLLALAAFPAPSSPPQRKYRTELPNLIDDLGLSVYAHRLYCHVRRVAGALAGGKCYESTPTLAEKTKMSTGSVSNAKAELLKAGLVKIKPGSKRDGTSDEITLVDIWAVNFAYFSELADRKKSEGVHHMNNPFSGDETKKQTPSGSDQPNGLETTTTQETGAREMLPAADVLGAAIVVASSPSALAEPIPDDLLLRMAELLGSPGAALALLKAKRADGLNPVDVCKQQVAWFPDRPARDGGAVLAQSIRENWGEPPAARRRREENEKGELQKAKTVVQQARADAEARDKAANTAALAAYYAALPDAQRAAVDAAVDAELKTHRMYEKLPPPGQRSLLQSTREKILAQWKEGKTHA